MTRAPAQFDPLLPEGVYLHLEPEKYFDQPALGSSDWIKLHFHKWGWHWQSRFNPDFDREQQKKKYLVYGTALHALLLEGVRAYEMRFAAMPDKKDFVDLVDSATEIKKALGEAGYDLTGKSKYAKADWNAEMASKLPDAPCWDNIVAAAQARAGDRTPISAVEDRQLRLMRDIATSPEWPGNEAVRRLFTPTADAPPLVEVSVFADIDGIRRRWRIDKMLAAADIDLKSLGGWRGRPLRHEIGEVIARHGLDIQRSDYFIGRGELYRLVREGKLFGGDVEERRHLKRIVATEPRWDWIWLFFQKPETSGRAPILFPVWDSSFGGPTGKYEDVGGGFQSEILDQRAPGMLRLYGERKLRKAIAFYKENVARFGLDRPWAQVETLHYTEPAAGADPEQVIQFPHWIQADEPVQREAYGEEEDE